MPPDAAEPGPWRSNRAPYAIPFQRACALPLTKFVAGIFSSQASKTDSSLNVVGQRLEDSPGPILWVGPTQNNVEKVIEPRVMAMVNQSRSLRAKYLGGHQSSKRLKRFAGHSRIRFAWGGSSTEMASDNARDVFADEIDKLAEDIGGEGSILGQLEARHFTYTATGRLIAISTPTHGRARRKQDNLTGFDYWVEADAGSISSPIWMAWQTGSRFEWAWPCFACNEFFIPHSDLLSLPTDCTPEEADLKTRLTCPNCGVELHERDKEWMNLRGGYVGPGQRILPWKDSDDDQEEQGYYLIDSKGAEDVRKATRDWDGVTFVRYGDVPPVPHGFSEKRLSFWVSGWCSTWMTWAQIGVSYVNALAAGDAASMMPVKNTKFGEVFSEEGDVPTSDALDACKGEFRMGRVPFGVQRIITTVDVQKKGLWVVTRGWGADYESWLLDFRWIEGETSHDAVWDSLDEYCETPWDGELSDLVLIDIGYRREFVLEFVRERNRRRFMMTRGRETIEAMYIKNQEEAKLRKSKVPYKFQVIKINTDLGKSWVHNRILRAVDDDNEKKSLRERVEATPDWHLPTNIEEEYALQVLAEERREKANGRGHEWIRRRKDNHALDLESMQVIGALLLEVSRLEPLVKPEDEGEEGSESDKPSLAEIFAPKVMPPADPYL